MSNRPVVYVANSASQDISVFGLRVDGGLEPLATVPIQRPAVAGKSVVLAHSPDWRCLYASYGNEGAAPVVVTYSIDVDTGIPAAVARTALGDSVAYLATDHTGRFLLGASYAGNQIMVHPIEPSGVVGPVQQLVATEAKAHFIRTDPTNRHVLHTSLGGDLIYHESFDARTGRLTPGVPRALSVRRGAGPRFLSFSPVASVVYALCEIDGSVLVLPYDAERGLLAGPIQTTTALPQGFEGKPWAADLHLTPDGRFLYACDRTSSTLAAFRVEAPLGTLVRLGTHATVEQPRAFAIDPDGRFLICSGQRAHAVRVYSIDPVSGALAVRGDYPVGGNPTWMLIG